MKITKTRLKEIIKEEFERLQREALDPRDNIEGYPPYVIKRLGASKYFVEFVNTLDGYKTVWGSKEKAWETDDKMRALEMQVSVEERSGLNTTIEDMPPHPTGNKQ